MLVAGFGGLAKPGGGSGGDGGRAVVATRQSRRGGNGRRKFGVGTRAASATFFISGATGLVGWTAGIPQVGVMDGHGGHREEAGAGRRVVLDLVGLCIVLGLEDHED